MGRRAINYGQWVTHGLSADALPKQRPLGHCQQSLLLPRQPQNKHGRLLCQTKHK